jgi:tetratricopeptide (TPR) repeat protein
MDRKEFIKNEINQDPKDPFNHYLLAIEYQKEGTLKESFDQFEELIIQFPDYVATYYTYANALLASEEEDKAEIIIQKGIEEAEKKGAAKALKELKQLLELNF